MECAARWGFCVLVGVQISTPPHVPPPLSLRMGVWLGQNPNALTHTSWAHTATHQTRTQGHSHTNTHTNTHMQTLLLDRPSIPSVKVPLIPANSFQKTRVGPPKTPASTTKTELAGDRVPSLLSLLCFPHSGRLHSTSTMHSQNGRHDLTPPVTSGVNNFKRY